MSWWSIFARRLTVAESWTRREEQNAKAPCIERRMNQHQTKPTARRTRKVFRVAGFKRHRNEDYREAHGRVCWPDGEHRRPGHKPTGVWDGGEGRGEGSENRIF